jgi:hypothetical protein
MAVPPQLNFLTLACRMVRGSSRRDGDPGSGPFTVVLVRLARASEQPSDRLLNLLEAFPQYEWSRERANGG